MTVHHLATDGTGSSVGNGRAVTSVSCPLFCQIVRRSFSKDFWGHHTGWAEPTTRWISGPLRREASGMRRLCPTFYLPRIICFGEGRVGNAGPPKDLDGPISLVCMPISGRDVKKQAREAWPHTTTTAASSVSPQPSCWSPPPQGQLCLPLLPTAEAPELMQVGRAKLSQKEHQRRLRGNLCFYCGQRWILWKMSNVNVGLISQTQDTNEPSSKTFTTLLALTTCSHCFRQLNTAHACFDWL